MTCPLTSFPIALDASMRPRSSYNGLTNTQVGLSITWGSGSDIPEFSQSASVQSGELSHSSFSRTSLKYNSNNYQLFSVQLTSPTHSSWLALKDSDVTTGNNLEDVILTFVSTEGRSPFFIILVNPIIRVPVPVQSSAFLTAFTTQNNSDVGPDSLYPNDRTKQFVYYNTCGQDIGNSNNIQVLVVVNVQGLLVWQNIMENILSIYRVERFTSFPSYVPPFYNLFVGSPTAPLTTFVGYGVSLGLGYASSVQTPNISREVLTDSYKCVPFNPERDVSGGALYIDSLSGTPLSNTLAKRQQEINNYNSTYTATIPYNILKKYTNIFLIIVFSILFVFIIIYGVLSFTVGATQVGSGASQLNLILTGILKTPIYVVIAFFCTFVGLFIGITLSPAATPSPAPAAAPAAPPPATPPPATPPPATPPPATPPPATPPPATPPPATPPPPPTASGSR
jgi:hypothetical protein